MRRCGFVVWLVFVCLSTDALQQYREKNIRGAETDAVQAILARYLQRRLQGSQLSTPPPPAVFFSSNHQARIRQANQRATSNALPRNVSEKERRGQAQDYEDYEDYEDDLEGFEDSERSRTRFDLFAEKCMEAVNKYMVLCSEVNLLAWEREPAKNAKIADMKIEARPVQSRRHSKKSKLGQLRWNKTS